jgi:transposase
MIPVPADVRIWLAIGYSDMRRGFPGPALLVQETPKRDPQSGHVFVFRGRRGIKIIWPDSQRLSSSRLGRGRFRCSSRAEGMVISPYSPHDWREVRLRQQLDATFLPPAVNMIPQTLRGPRS